MHRGLLSGARTIDGKMAPVLTNMRSSGYRIENEPESQAQGRHALFLSLFSLGLADKEAVKIKEAYMYTIMTTR